MDQAVLTKLSNSKQKYVVAYNGKNIKFGASGYSDFTIHKDELRKQRYIKRHSKDHIKDPNKAGFWAMWVLWNKKTINASLKDIQKRFKIHVTVKRN